MRPSPFPVRLVSLLPFFSLSCFFFHSSLYLCISWPVYIVLAGDLQVSAGFPSPFRSACCPCSRFFPFLCFFTLHRCIFWYIYVLLAADLCQLPAGFPLPFLSACFPCSLFLLFECHVSDYLCISLPAEVSLAAHAPICIPACHLSASCLTSYFTSDF